MSVEDGAIQDQDLLSKLSKMILAKKINMEAIS